MLKSDKYQLPTTAFEVDNPIHLFTTNGNLFSAMLYDQRMQAATGFAPAPEMMSIVPFSKWTTQYSAYIPKGPRSGFVSYFIVILCRLVDYQRDSIIITINGGEPRPIKKSGLSQQKQFSLPDYPGYVGVILKVVDSSSIHFKNIARGDDNASQEGFMVYRYGFEGFDPVGTMGDFDQNDFSYAYGNPSGCVYGNNAIDTSNLSATIQTQCDGWRICVTSSTAQGNGIRYIELLDIPYLRYYAKQKYDTVVSYNIELDQTVDPLHKGDIILPGTDGSFCFFVKRKDVSDSSHLAVAIYDNAGKRIMVQASSANTLTTTAKGDLYPASSSSFYFSATRKDSTHCGQLVLYNAGKTATENITISSLSLLNGTKGIALSSPQVALPLLIKAGDSAAIPICFTAGDSLDVEDVLNLVTSCGLKVQYAISARKSYSRLFVNDTTFGNAVLDNTSCKTLQLKNSGTGPVVIGSLSLSDTTNFWISNSSRLLPTTLDSGASMNITICFRPSEMKHYSAELSVNSNLTAEDLQHSKIIAALEGDGSKITFVWYPTALHLIMDSTAINNTFKKIYLYNTSDFSASVERVSITGENASEFTIVSSENGFIQNYNLLPHDSNWYLISFTPDLTKSGAEKFAPRTAYLECLYLTVPSDFITDIVKAEVLGTFTGPSSVVASGGTESTGHAYVEGRSILVVLPVQVNSDCTEVLYDMLGREVYRWDIKADANKLHLPLPELPAGTYMVKVLVAGNEYHFKLQITK